MIFKDTTTTIEEEEEEDQQEEEGEEIIYTYGTNNGGGIDSDDHRSTSDKNKNNNDDDDDGDDNDNDYHHHRHHHPKKFPRYDPTFAYYPPQPPPPPSTSTPHGGSSRRRRRRHHRHRYDDRDDKNDDRDQRDDNNDNDKKKNEVDNNDATCCLNEHDNHDEDDDNDDDQLYHDRFELVIVAAATSLEEEEDDDDGDPDSKDFDDEDDQYDGGPRRHHYHRHRHRENDEAAELVESTTTTTTKKEKTKTVVLIDPPPTRTMIQHAPNKQEQLPPPATVGEPKELTKAMTTTTIDPARKNLQESHGGEEQEQEEQGQGQEQVHDDDQLDSRSSSTVNDLMRTKEDPDGLVFNDVHENEQAVDQYDADSGRGPREKVCDENGDMGVVKDDSNSDNHDTVIYCHLSSENFCNYFDGNDMDNDDDHGHYNDNEQKRLDDRNGSTACAAVVVTAIATAAGTNAAATADLSYENDATVIDDSKFVMNSHGFHDDDDDDNVQEHDDGKNLEEHDCEENSGHRDYEGENEAQHFNDLNGNTKPEQKEGKVSSTGSKINNGKRNSHHSHDDADDEDINGPEQQLSPEEGRHSPRSTWTMAFSTVVLCLELAVAMIALIFHDDIMECCDQSIFSRNEETADRWNKAMFGIAIGYLCLVVVEIPIVVLLEEPFFLFNPMIGFLLTIHMMYVTNTGQAYVMFGLESVAMLGQSIILIHMERNAEVCLHAIFNYTICGLVVYILIELTREGGYCIVDGELQTVFQESTCNMLCTDDEACFVCDIDSLNGQVTDATNSSCFILFPSTGWFY